MIDGGDTIYLRTTLRDLTPTFGDPIGAQLLTIFARDPANTATSTAAFFPSRNYTVDPWTRAIQVRGFESPRFVDSAFAPPGAISVQASAVTKTITILVPKAAFGTPGAGWTYNVILHGQDGFGQDGARTFTPTAGSYTFGRCAVDPSSGSALPGPARPAPESDGRARPDPGHGAGSQPRPGRHPRSVVNG